MKHDVSWVFLDLLDLQNYIKIMNGMMLDAF